jgi:hypothetical protein
MCDFRGGDTDSGCRRADDSSRALEVDLACLGYGGGGGGRSDKEGSGLGEYDRWAEGRGGRGGGLAGCLGVDQGYDDWAGKECAIDG